MYKKKKRNFRGNTILLLTGLEISARPLAQASVKTVGRVQIMDHSPGLASTIFNILFKISGTFTFQFKIIYTVHKPIAYQHFEISIKAICLQTTGI